MESPSCIGVSPAACTSLSSGMEIIPSARTGNEFVRSGSFQTETKSVSSGPILYEALTCGMGGGAVGALAGVDCWVQASNPLNKPPIPTSILALRFIIFSVFLPHCRQQGRGPWQGLRRSVLAVANLLEFVKQSLIADLQILGGSAAVPAGPGQRLQDQFLFGFPRCGP